MLNIINFFCHVQKCLNSKVLKLVQALNDIALRLKNSDRKRESLATIDHFWMLVNFFTLTITYLMLLFLQDYDGYLNSNLLAHWSVSYPNVNIYMYRQSFYNWERKPFVIMSVLRSAFDMIESDGQVTRFQFWRLAKYPEICFNIFVVVRDCCTTQSILPIHYNIAKQMRHVYLFIVYNSF